MRRDAGHCAVLVGELGKKTPTRNTHAYQLLKAIFNTAVQDKLVTENPCQIKSASKHPSRVTWKALSPCELEQVAQEVPEAYRVALPVAAWCGLRFGELIELRRKDVHDGERLVLKIRRAGHTVGKGLEIGPPKTEAGIRDVTVPPHVARCSGRTWPPVPPRGRRRSCSPQHAASGSRQRRLPRRLRRGFAEVGKPGMRVHDCVMWCDSCSTGGSDH